ncbi:MAG: hypothetical protein ACI8W1_002668, partial [Candidatus Azotimanducaceae bacterium]
SSSTTMISLPSAKSLIASSMLDRAMITPLIFQTCVSVALSLVFIYVEKWSSIVHY